MNPVGKALWFIESHFAREITLDDVSCIGGVSRYHMTRAFGETTGCSIMRYVRERRLTEAARRLATGAPDILAIALDAGYGSHEAFTRAFRDQFGITPEAVRAQRHLQNLQLREPIKMNETVLQNFAPPRFETAPALLVAGLSEHYSCETSAAIPSQWQKFVPELNYIPGRIGRQAFGVRYNSDSDGNFDYLCGVEVADFSRVPKDWTRLRIGPQRYAVFSHRDHISSIRSTWASIWNKWLPESGLQVLDAPDFERYGEDFNGETGFGSVEIWIPVQA